MLTNTNNTQLWPHNKQQWLNATTRLTTSLSHMRTTHWRAAGRIAQRYPQRTPHFVVVILIWTIPHTITYWYCYKSCCPVAAGGKRRTLSGDSLKELSWLNRVWCFVCFFLANYFSHTNVGSLCVYVGYVCVFQFFNSWHYKIKSVQI